MGMRRVLGAAGAVVLLAGGVSLLGAIPASADQVWHQSVGRASAAATCPDLSTAEQSAGWSRWGASWEQWANGGKGGFTCSRSITWAFSSPAPTPAPTAVCTVIPGGGLVPDTSVLVGPSGFITSGTALYNSTTCTGTFTTLNNILGYAVVLIGDPTVRLALADVICRAANIVATGAVPTSGYVYPCQ